MCKALNSLKGRGQFCIFFYFSSNFSEICTQYVKSELRINFWHKFYLFFYEFCIFFFLKKKLPSHSTKKNRSRWVFILHIWFTYQNEAKSIRKMSSALFFYYVWINFQWPSNRKKLKCYFFSTIILLQVYITKKHCWKWKIQSWSFFPYPFTYVLMCKSSL